MGDILKLPDKSKPIDYESEMERKLRGDGFVTVGKGWKTKIGSVISLDYSRLLRDTLKRT